MEHPIIIIGAARSGTNMLRDIITQLPGFGTWPCDEINYIWRHGNARYPNDEFSVEQASGSVKKFIRRAFARVARKQGLKYVVEKTCANSLRVAFVEKVFPDAKFIFIVRDGRDVVTSAMKRWRAPLDIPYVVRKARYVPITDGPYYATQYLARQIYRIFSKEKRVSSWGPRFEGMEEMLKIKSLPEICGVQWAHSVQLATKAFGSMKSKKVLRIKYEDFVSSPVNQLKLIAEFLGVDLKDRQARHLVSSVSDSSVGKWKNDLDAKTMGKIMHYIKPELKEYGYLDKASFQMEQ